MGYNGVIAQGDIEYPDGFDSWEDIEKVFKENKEVNVVRDHDNDTRVIGVLKNFNIDQKNKLIGINFDGNDIEEGELDEYMQVSPEWKVDEDGRIVGINHIAIGNSFKQLCSEKVCGITKTPEESTSVDDSTTEIPDESKDIALLEEKLKKQAEQIVELNKEKDKIKLGFKDKHRQPTHVAKDEPTFKAGIDFTNLTANTKKIRERYLRK